MSQDRPMQERFDGIQNELQDVKIALAEISTLLRPLVDNGRPGAISILQAKVAEQAVQIGRLDSLENAVRDIGEAVHDNARKLWMLTGGLITLNFVFEFISRNGFTYLEHLLGK